LPATGHRDPEVLEKPERRRFTAEYKARMLAEADACVAPGQVGALLRREGLYASALTTWRKQREEGSLKGLAPTRRGRKRQKDPLTEEKERLLREKLRKAELIIDVPKKLPSFWEFRSRRLPIGKLTGAKERVDGRRGKSVSGSGRNFGLSGPGHGTGVSVLFPVSRSSARRAPGGVDVFPGSQSPGAAKCPGGALHSDACEDQTPATVYAALLDEGKYLCSVRTMYRILAEHKEVRARRNQLRHPHYQKPELLATCPKQVWSWDITKLLGPEKYTHYYLYVILDVFSRYAVGWMLSVRESADLAQRLLRETAHTEMIVPDQLTLHSDRGPSLQSQSVAQLLATLGVTTSHSRPKCSNDNPFSESQFKTLTYRPEFPARFASFEAALQFCRRFFHRYNQEHYHSGIGFLTPAMVHHGHATDVIAKRQKALDVANNNESPVTPSNRYTNIGNQVSQRD